MLQYITKDLISQLPIQIKQGLIGTIGKTPEYQSNPENINVFFTIGILVDLLNKHINTDFNLKKIEYLGFSGWRITTDAFTSADKELVIALWKSVVYAYDSEKRQKEIEEKEKIWRNTNDELVTIRSNS